ncbi:MAG TPA: hypothetical protein PLM16_02890, partial [Candidatus Woesebacteria bacterium]|nr:hypothetical protein [Candidatus Woesebacteria bacterium]
FWFLRKRDDQTSSRACEQFTNYQGKNPPIVIALKIPTFATNSILSYPIYDSGTITANIFDTISNQPDNQETEYVIKSFTDNLKTSREEKLRIAFDKQTQSKASEEEQALLVINCTGTTACDGAHGAGTELTRALVNIINANENSCLSDKYDNPPISANEPLTDEKLQQILYDTNNPNPLESYEYAAHIGSPAHYKFNPNRAFLAEHYNVMLNSYSLGVENWYWGLEVDRAEAEKIQNNVDGEHLKQNLKAHLVAPIGTNLSYVETMLSSLFSTESLKTLIENNELIDSADVTYQDGTTGPKTGDIARYLPILNTTLKYDAQAWTVEYPHADACPCEKTEVCLDIPKPTDPSKCVNKETFCETIVVDWPSGSNQEDKKIACVKGGVAFRDNYLDNEQQMGFAIKGAKLGFFIRKIQLAVTQMNSLNESYEYLTSCERIEDLFLGRCGGSPNKYSPDRDYTQTPRSEAPNSCMYRGMKVVVPSECALVKMVLDKAAQYDLDPTMLWGLIKIENPSFLEAVQRGQLETNCAVNACGAIGPFQILQGVCVQLEACMELEAKILGGQPEDYRDFVINSIMPIRRNVNPCDIVEALDWTAETLSARKAAAQKIIDDLPPNRETWEYDIDCRLAGYHWGDTTCTPDVSPACKGQSYCQCACEETRDVGRYSTSSGGTFESLRQSCGL